MINSELATKRNSDKRKRRFRDSRRSSMETLELFLRDKAPLVITVFLTVVCLLLVYVLLRALTGEPTQEEKRTAMMHDSVVVPGYLPDMAEVVVWGQGGAGVFIDPTKLNAKNQEEYTLGYKEFAFNQFVSDRISIRRTLPDVRHRKCTQYSPDSLPLLVASVIIVFHNEPWTTLMRTVYSVIDRSPPSLLKEIILLDNGSTRSSLKFPILERYLQPLGKVRVIRLQDRLGLAQGLTLGVREMSGDVAVFLPPHCEATEGWLPPLLGLVAQNTTRVAVPVIDVIRHDTFEYLKPDENVQTVRSFTWDLMAKTRQFQNETESPTSSFPCPAVIDGIFAIAKDFLLSMGGFNEHFYGSDVMFLDLSFKTWLCAGSIHVVPCSHVGHVYPRLESQVYQFTDETLIKERLLLARLWMEEYSIFVEEHMAAYQYVSRSWDSRHKTTARNSCHSFGWFLQNVEPTLLPNGTISRRGKLTQIVPDETVLTVNSRGGSIVVEDWYKRPTSIWYLMTSGQLVTNTSMCLAAREKLTYKPKTHVTDNSKPLLVGSTYKFLRKKSHLNTNPVNYVDKKSERVINPLITNSEEYNFNPVEPESSRKQTGNRQTLNPLLFRGKGSEQGAKSSGFNQNTLQDGESLHKFSIGRNILQYKAPTSETLERTKRQLSRENLARLEVPQLLLDDSAPGIAPVTLPFNAPVNAPVDAPANVPVYTPANAPVNTLVDAPANAPVNTLADAPANAPANAPVNAAAPLRIFHVPHSDVDAVSDVHFLPCQSVSSAKDSWSFIQDGFLRHDPTGLCLTAYRSFTGTRVLKLLGCVDDHISQVWQFV
ncbi:probable N-acetylgalactosaminyltransferase 6 [Physella acuta]|uniref:probable N-acetylgalactosaminyltransferase 6 n=1 Tax=Physella acuta TaxID=109671 RepID=UPI0027DBD528|nr:probable N-acetylgalactosaminyltransferase 6 [Physella acuta]